jgi:hypothetical protein
MAGFASRQAGCKTASMKDKHVTRPPWAAAVPAGAAIAALAVTLLAAPSAADAQPAQERLIGIYRLVRFTAHGSEPIGRIEYDAGNRMWAMIFPPKRKPIRQGSTPEEYRDTMRGVIAYYGTYTVDEPTGRVIHRVQAASNPAWIGDDFIRWYRFDGSNLLISLNPSFDNPLVWERLPQGPNPVPARNSSPSH